MNDWNRCKIQRYFLKYWYCLTENVNQLRGAESLSSWEILIWTRNSALWNSNVNYRVQKNQPLEPILRQFNPGHILTLVLSDLF
jgi:hypothetical protein